MSGDRKNSRKSASDGNHPEIVDGQQIFNLEKTRDTCKRILNETPKENLAGAIQKQFGPDMKVEVKFEKFNKNKKERVVINFVEEGQKIFFHPKMKAGRTHAYSH